MEPALASESAARGGLPRGIRGACAGGLAAAAVALLPHLIAGFGINVLARGAATLASLLTGSPVVEVDGGFALPTASTPVLVTTACSAADFCCVLAALLGWHLVKQNRRLYFGVPVAVAASFGLGIAINALRIAALAQVHRWIIPRFPAPYAHFLHLLIGVGVFVPALLALDLLLELHGRRHSNRRC